MTSFGVSLGANHCRVDKLLEGSVLWATQLYATAVIETPRMLLHRSTILGVALLTSNSNTMSHDRTCHAHRHVLDVIDAGSQLARNHYRCILQSASPEQPPRERQATTQALIAPSISPFPQSNSVNIQLVITIAHPGQQIWPLVSISSQPNLVVDHSTQRPHTLTIRMLLTGRYGSRGILTCS